MTNKPDIMSMTLPELCEFVKSLGEPSFRAKQLFSWMHAGAPIDRMTNLSKKFRERLTLEADYRLPTIEEKYVSKLDGTVKYLFSLSDGECVESVLMKYEHGNTICVSSQAGCRMGCKFCASTLAGKVRDLTPSEILGQVVLAAADSGERVHGIVMMGIGEPLDNYDNVIRFLRLVGDENGLNIGMRHISLSTCGIVPGIKRLADEGIPVTLSVSLHAYDNETRRSIMPIANKYSIDELLAACKYYFDKTGRRVSFEYTLISGKNDSMADAAGLASLLKRGMGVPCHVNLIMLNEVDETGMKTVNKKNAAAFANELCRLGQNATVRRRLGSDIDASCGQLRLNRNRNAENA
ncbi:MAG: 23S rRNA (adenine(2503)-C(2))-methyltransferase RlmN [Clostridia bacterium]|nr:23S rRNA (adenine(2503)-C(2))-methyltransferase RlmN [Clostridia bacterium]